MQRLLGILSTSRQFEQLNRLLENYRKTIQNSAKTYTVSETDKTTFTDFTDQSNQNLAFHPEGN